MKKVVSIVLIVVGIQVGCTITTQENKQILVSRDDSVKQESLEQIDSALKDWPFPGANGDWLPSRDGLENCDTIVDGFPYNRV